MYRRTSLGKQEPMSLLTLSTVFFLGSCTGNASVINYGANSKGFTASARPAMVARRRARREYGKEGADRRLQVIGGVGSRRAVWTAARRAASANKKARGDRLERWWVSLSLVIQKTGKAALMALHQAPSNPMRPPTCHLWSECGRFLQDSGVYAIVAGVHARAALRTAFTGAFFIFCRGFSESQLTGVHW